MAKLIFNNHKYQRQLQAGDRNKLDLYSLPIGYSFKEVLYYEYAVTSGAGTEVSPRFRSIHLDYRTRTTNNISIAMAVV